MATAISYMQFAHFHTCDFFTLCGMAHLYQIRMDVVVVGHQFVANMNICYFFLSYISHYIFCCVLIRLCFSLSTIYLQVKLNAFLKNIDKIKSWSDALAAIITKLYIRCNCVITKRWAYRRAKWMLPRYEIVYENEILTITILWYVLFCFV